jgi:hypothetical protein
VSPDGTITTRATDLDAIGPLALDPAGRVFLATGTSGVVQVDRDGTVTPLPATSTAAGTAGVSALAWSDGLLVATPDDVRRVVP